MNLNRSESQPVDEDGLSSQAQPDETVFDLSREELDELPYGVVTLDRQGTILRYNRAEESLADRPAQTAIGLDFFTEVAPCTNVHAFRGRFDEFARRNDSGAQRFDFSFSFRWGRQDVSITLLRKAGHSDINILVRGHSMMSPVEERAMFAPRARSTPIPSLVVNHETAAAQPEFSFEHLPHVEVCCLGGSDEAAVRRRVHPHDAAAVRVALGAASLARSSYAIQYRCVRPDDSVAFIEEYGSFAGETGTMTLVDVTLRRQREDANWRDARYDRLTGLPNRTFLLARIEDAVRACAPGDRVAAILASNVDKFREVNNTFGYEIGDMLLGMLGRRLSGCLHDRHTVARLGGDCFGVLLTGVTSGRDITEAVTRLVAAVAQPFVIDERPYYLTLSTGISVAPYDGNDPESLLRSADMAMCVAKADGGNSYRWYGSEMSVDAANNTRCHNELRAALERGELELYYQPIVDIAHGRAVAVESLVRWNHPTRGLLAPGEFIALADRTGLIIPLGEWVLREACRQAGEWCRLGFDLRICVNVSAVQFHQANFVDLVDAVLRDNDLAPERLELELTESVMVDGFAPMIETLSRLKLLGVRLAIDDFGTGYSSLAYLKYFPVDTLKLDRAFVIDITSDPFDRAIATAVFTLAQELKLDCVVEGIENAQHRDTVRAIGCTLLQGYHFAKPTTAHKLQALLAAPFAPPSPTIDKTVIAAVG